MVTWAQGEMKETQRADNNTDVFLNVAVHPQWVEDAGRRGCKYANGARSRYGRHQLYYSASLTKLAARHSNWMAHYQIFKHQNIKGMGTRANGHWIAVTAENIAMSKPRSSDPAYDAHKQWYYSKGHFLNMISAHHSHCGVGIAYDRYGRWWGTQLFGYNTRVGNEYTGGRRAAAPTAAPTAAPATTSSSPSGRSFPSVGLNRGRNLGTPRPRATGSKKRRRKRRASTALINSDLATSLVANPVSGLPSIG